MCCVYIKPSKSVAASFLLSIQTEVAVARSFSRMACGVCTFGVVMGKAEG